MIHLSHRAAHKNADEQIFFRTSGVEIERGVNKFLGGTQKKKKKAYW